MSTPQEVRDKRLARLEALAKEQKESQGVPDIKPSTMDSTMLSSPPVPKLVNTQQVNHSQGSEQNSKPIYSSSVAKRTSDVKSIDIDQWTTNEIERVMKVSLIEDVANEKNIFYIESLKEDLDGCLTLSVDDIDSVLVDLLFESGVSPLYKSALSYLYETWSRANDSKRLIRNSDPFHDQKIHLANEIIRLSSSYGSILFQASDMFIDTVDVASSIEEIWTNIHTYSLFWIDIVGAVVANQAELDFLSIVLPSISERFLTLDYTTDSNFVKLITVIQLMVNNKKLASHFHLVDDYHPDGLKGNEFETKTILGRILRVSPLLPEISILNYTEGLTKIQIRSIHESLQTSYPMTISRLFSICDGLIRASSDSRLEILKWMADLVNKNHLRRGEHADPKTLASDSIMLNITMILLKLSQPILRDGSASKIDKISIDYLNCRKKLIDIDEETKINSTIQEYDEYYSSNSIIDEPLNFISECFYMMLTYLHYGLGGMIVNSNRNSKIVKQIQQQLKAFEGMMEKTMSARGGNPQANPLVQMIVKTKIDPMKKELTKYKSMKLSIDMFFYGRDMQLEIFDAIIGSIEFFIRLIDPTHKYHPKNGEGLGDLSIPLHNFDDDTEKLDDVEYLRSISPIPFKYYPEMFIEGIVNYCHHISKFNNNPMVNNELRLNKFVEFAIMILRCPELVSNPHLKSRLTEVLFFGSLSIGNVGRSGNEREQDGYMIDIFNNNDVVKKNLLISLLDFYVMVEKTGASSQFYDKFNARYHISYIVEKLWKFDYFKEDLKRISNTLQKFFVRLIARMLNDTTYLLDESLNHLHTIHSCQKELNNRQKGFEPSSEESDEDLQKKLQESERMAKSFVQLSNKTILLFNLFTKETPRSFVIVEIVDRLAGMLNYNLVVLVGPKYNELKVNNPEAYQFDPKELLFQLCSIFINLSKEPEFVEAVARDLRSFDPECFRTAINILKKGFKISDENFEKNLFEFTAKAESCKKDDEEEETELGEIPDEFLDPLMYTLMKDPVKLPTSKISMDRSVLKAHLMNDPTDPFNRSQLKMDEVEDDLDLKDKIEKWIKEKKLEKKMAKLGDNEGDVTMG